MLEFLGLKDEYAETELEAALIAKIEACLLSSAGTSHSWVDSVGCASGTPGIGI